MPEENKPLVTIIIPTYQRPKLLKRAILSVLNQTYPNFQICIYDNASRDETAEVVKELAKKDSRIQYYCHSKNIGAEKNFNFGAKNVDTPYFAFLSDDDILLPNFLEDALEGFKKYPEAGFIVTQTLITTDKKIKAISFSSYEEKLYLPPEGLLKLSRFETVTWTGILFNSKTVKKIGYLDDKIEGSCDYEFLLRIASCFPFAIIKSVGALYFVHPLSWSVAASTLKLYDGCMKMLAKTRNNKNIPALIKDSVYQNVRHYIIYFLWFGGFRDIIKKDFTQAKQLAKHLKNDSNESFKSIVLDCSARLCEVSNIFYYCFLGLYQIRNFLKKELKENKLQNIYGEYLKYFNKYSS